MSRSTNCESTQFRICANYGGQTTRAGVARLSLFRRSNNVGEVKHHYFCHEDGIFTLERLFKKKKIKAMRRVIGKDGHAKFYICEYWNPRWKNGSQWRLTDPELIVKAIAMGKKRNIQFYREVE